MANIDFKQKLKEEFGFESKSRSRENSIFAVVKEQLQTKNSGRTELFYKILTELREVKHVEINDETFKKVNKLISNLLTYVRKSYEGYEAFELVETDKCLQMIKKI